MKAGCARVTALKFLQESDPDKYEQVCGTVRDDGIYTIGELSQSDSHHHGDLFGYLQANPGAMVLMNVQPRIMEGSGLAAAVVDGVVPTTASIRAGSYVGSRPLYLYANTNPSAKPTMRPFIFWMWRTIGVMTPLPLVAPDEAELRDIREQGLSMPELNL